MRKITVPILAALSTLLALLAVPTPAVAQTGGEFSVLSYNINGLPFDLGDSTPSVSTPIIGRRIEPYDVVHVQEDFNYHAALYANNDHPHRTPTSGGVAFGDGLNTLAHHPYSDFQRVRWSNCVGVDCLTPKGFTFSRIRLAEGVYIDFYNLHAQAGSSGSELSARRQNITQLANFIGQYSAGNAVVVAGDTNTRYTRSGDNIRELVDSAGLTDAWVEDVRGGQPPAAGDPALTCGDAAVVDEQCEVVDKILYRGSRFVDLELSEYRNDHPLFTHDDGEMLSDHYPIAADFSWNLNDEFRMSDVVGGPHGTPFTDIDDVPTGSPVTELWLRAGNRVDGIGIGYADGTRLSHGGSGGSESRLTLADGEYLTEVTLATGQRNGRTRVFYADFVTSAGNRLTAGTPTANQTTVTAPAGWQIAGFHGRSGAEIDKLGVIFTPAG